MRAVKGFLAENGTFCESQEEARHEDARAMLVRMIEMHEIHSYVTVEQVVAFIHDNLESVGEYVEATKAIFAQQGDAAAEPSGPSASGDPNDDAIGA